MRYPPRTRTKVLALDTFQVACQWTLGVMAILGIILLSGCSKRYDDMPAFSPFDIKDSTNYSVGRFKSSYLAEQIDNYYRGSNPGPIGVTTFVNLDDLNTTSSFGRMYSEQMMSELSMRGFDVVELRHSDALNFLSSSGEFGLSRDASMVRRERDLGGVVVGTYVVSPVRVYVNARLLDPSTSMVLSASSVEMPKSEEIAKMLRGGAYPSTLERIPVKHMEYATYPMSLFPATMRRHQYEDEDGPVAPRYVEPAPKGKSAPLAVKPRIIDEHILK